MQYSLLAAQNFGILSVVIQILIQYDLAEASYQILVAGRWQATMTYNFSSCLLAKQI
jgi:hypothetical protein